MTYIILFISLALVAFLAKDLAEHKNRPRG